MKKLIAAILLILAVFSAPAQRKTFEFDLENENHRQALYGALDNATEALRRAPFGLRPIAILPLKKGYNDILLGRLKNMLVQANFVCVEGKEDPMWDEILKEIEWDERKDDILDPSTVVKFGKLKAAKILFQCEVRLVSVTQDRIYAELELRATDIATKKILWGGTFSHRYYIGKNVQGIISRDQLDGDVRVVLKKNFELAKKSLMAPHIAAKYNHVKTITVVPLSGDIDSYITDLAAGMLSQTSLVPQNPHIPSLAQIRATARDGFLKTDAVFYGYVRDLHKTNVYSYQSDDEMVTEYRVVTEIQLFVEDAKTGDILWSDTIALDEPFRSSRQLTNNDLQMKNVWGRILFSMKKHFIDCWHVYLIVIGILAALVLILFVAIAAIKSYYSVKNIR